MAEFDPGSAARLLLEARRQRERLIDLPETQRPRTIEEAYAIQTATLRALGGTGGWKFVARRGDEAPRCAPIPAETFYEMPIVVPPEGLVGPEVEAEVAVRFARDLPATGAPYAERDVLAAIGTLHPALEILSSRYRDRTKAHRLSTLADLLSSAGVVLGPGIQGWDRFDLARIAVTMSVDGVEIEKAETGAGNRALLETLTWLVNLAAARGDPFRAGQVVITGSRVGPVRLPSKPDTHVAAEVSGLGKVAATIRQQRLSVDSGGTAAHADQS